jgi:hypothetical protein
MASNNRQNSLLANEDWSKIYRSFTDADFTSYDFPTLRRTMINYLRNNYPEDFNDYIESSEYLALIDLIAFLGQSISYRIDLNARENFIELAEQKDSILRLARLVGYNTKRNQGASGLLKVIGVQTTEGVQDSLGVSLANRFIVWNDETNTNWLEQFQSVLNSAMPGQMVIGKPAQSAVVGGIQSEQYKFNTTNTDVPLFNFSKSIQGRNINFEIISAGINNTNITEETPVLGNSVGFLYRNDKRGNSSPNTGFFFHFKQGQLQSSAFSLRDPSPNEIVNVDVPNINNSDLWLWQLDRFGNYTNLWTKLDSVYGSNVVYNSINQQTRTIYSVVSRDQDQISLNFADGNFGELPKGDFRLYYRTSNGLNYTILPTNMQNIVIEVPYVNKNGVSHTMIIQMGLQSSVTNSSPTEDVDSIRENAPQAFYTQNRMITGEDYNTFPLTSNQSIIKAKAVNRASSGISRQYDIADPTGKYSTTNLIADDGILYKNDFETDFTFTFQTRNDVLGVLRNSIEPIITSLPTKAFYYDKFPRVSTSGINIDWVHATSSSSSSTGYFRNNVNDAPITVGTFTSNNFKFVQADSMIKFVPPSGRYFLPNGTLTTTATKNTSSYIWAKVINVVGDGSNGGQGNLDDDTGPVILSENIPSLAIPSEVIPNIITDLPTDIETEIVDLVFNYKTFGLRYDQSSLTWKIIANANLNTREGFSLDRQGDTTGTKSDKSWFVLFSNDGETYTVTYRGLDYRFESENLIQFFVDIGSKKFNSETGKVIKDQVKVLKVNEDPVSDTILAKDFQWEIISAVTSVDGYQETNKIAVNFYDSDDDGMIDDPDSFVNIVKPENVDVRGYKDKFVFFQSVIVGNNTVTSKIDSSNFVVFDKEEKVTLANFTDGQLFYFYDQSEDVVKQYDATLGSLVLKTDYYAKPGRDGIKFQYIHNAENDRRLDPSKTNLIDLYVLTDNYDREFRSYINGGGIKPTPPTTEQLSMQFEDSLNKVKAISDEIIFHSVRYKSLFGTDAESSLQATFKVVKSSGITLSDNEIRSSVIDAINEFFTIDNWNFGDSFYFTELATYVQTKMIPNVANFVIVPRSSSQTFGSLFQVSSRSDEIFISTATVDNVEVIDSITAANLKADGNIITSIDQVTGGVSIASGTTTSSSGY